MLTVAERDLSDFGLAASEADQSVLFLALTSSRRTSEVERNLSSTSDLDLGMTPQKEWTGGRAIFNEVLKPRLQLCP